MKLLYILGVFLLFGAAFCEEETPEEPSDEVADQPEDEQADEQPEDEQADEQPEDEQADEDEDEQADEDEDKDEDEDEEDDDDESDVEDPSHKKRRCRRKKVCSRRRECRPKYFYVKGSRRVRYCFKKLLKRYKKVCKTFCWHTQGYGHGKYYKKGRKICKKRCYKVPKTKTICRYRTIHFPLWKFKNVCKTVKDCYTVPIGKCGKRRHHQY